MLHTAQKNVLNDLAVVGAGELRESDAISTSLWVGVMDEFSWAATPVVSFRDVSIEMFMLSGIAVVLFREVREKYVGLGRRIYVPTDSLHNEPMLVHNAKYFPVNLVNEYCDAML